MIPTPSCNSCTVTFNLITPPSDLHPLRHLPCRKCILPRTHNLQQRGLPPCTSENPQPNRSPIVLQVPHWERRRRIACGRDQEIVGGVRRCDDHVDVVFLQRVINAFGSSDKAGVGKKGGVSGAGGLGIRRGDQEVLVGVACEGLNQQ